MNDDNRCDVLLLVEEKKERLNEWMVGFFRLLFIVGIHLGGYTRVALNSRKYGIMRWEGTD
eukprot:CAMPEP_0202441946 /NCGR_PEP_ID=MMETSP1360-20130828/1471_1 /ASSEMBLY_ACC=CAM_ASM_000848 /TAXON_ID=515479 /ORGANISM="Licmophora paradoxa, Strain CCMP2313" /LENGTH=60 /DNA_ID=CAMNT_0049057159 /DNA_START=455 /DNA_END=637 /DNA_ORIENTATION=+